MKTIFSCTRNVGRAALSWLGQINEEGRQNKSPLLNFQGRTKFYQKERLLSEPRIGEPNRSRLEDCILSERTPTEARELFTRQRKYRSQEPAGRASEQVGRMPINKITVIKVTKKDLAEQ